MTKSSFDDFQLLQVSVIIPTYNSASFLPDAIKSVIRQTYPVFEIIVVDDGSIDETKAVCERYPSVTYVYQSNQGVAEARNTGLNISKGEYLIFLDSDDCLLPQAVEIGVDCIKTRPEVGFVFGGYVFQKINPDGSYTTEDVYDKQPELASYTTILAAQHKIQCGCIVFQKVAIKTVGGFDQSLSPAEDINLFLRIAREFPIHFHGQIVSEYRYNGNNLSSKAAKMLTIVSHAHSLQWNYIQQTGNKEYEIAYECGKQYWTKLFVERLPYEVMRFAQSDNWISALGTFRLILAYDPKLKYIDESMYESSRQAVLSQLRSLPLESSLAYWKQQLAGAPSLLPLPTDRPRSATPNLRAGTQSFVLSPELTSSLSLLSSQNRVTLFVTLLAAFNTLLYRYTGANDIIVGTPIINHEDYSEIFVNAVVLRSDMSKKPSFQTLLRQVQKTVLAANVHQDVPFEILVEELQPQLQSQRDLSYSPLFQVMFMLEENISLQKIDHTSLTASSWVLEQNEARFDLTLFLKPINNEIEGKWIYNPALFNIDTIKRINEHFQTLLNGIVADPKQSISELVLLTDRDQKQLLLDWNETDTAYPSDKCIHQLFAEQADRTPDAVALVFADQQLTYRELNNQANQLAHYLHKSGVVADELVGICIERSLEMIVGLLGILKAGGAYLPIDSNYPQERIEYILENSQAKVLLTQQHLVINLPTNDISLVCVDTDFTKISQESQQTPICNVTPDNIAYVNYTSGSTGKPKGVETPHRGVTRLLFGVDYINFNAENKFLQMAPISFDASTLEIWGALLHGAQCVLFLEKIPTSVDLRKTIQKHDITTVWLTSALFNLIIDTDPKSLEGLQHLLTGGEALSVNHVQRAIKALPSTQLINGYGPTESTTFACCYQIPKDLDSFVQSIPIGRPIGNTQVYILDTNLRPVPIGVSGEMHIGGAGLARGYLNRPELTEEKFIPNPFGTGKLYKTGDFARYKSNGDIEFIGRIDNQVKIRGFRIELGEIEVLLIKHPEIREVVVTVREDVVGDKRLVAYVLPLQNREPSANDLREFLSQNLPQYMIPAFFVMLDVMPLTPNGKVDRKALLTYPLISDSQPLATNENTNKSIVNTGVIPNDGYVTPRNPTEKILVDIWSRVLGLDRVGINDNFFLLGGHSLSSVRLISEIERAFSIQFPLSSIFKISTIAEIAEWISQNPVESIPTNEFTGGLNLEDYRALLSHSAGMTGSRLGKRGLIINIEPEIEVTSQPFVWIGEVKTGKRLKLKQPIYVMPGASLSKSMNTYDDYISVIASLLVDELLTVQVADSYSLGGWCYNGLVAMAMAQQLQKLDKKVDLLTLIDVPGKSKVHRLFSNLNLRIGTLRFHLFNLSQLSFKEKWRYVSQRINRKKLDPHQTKQPDKVSSEVSQAVNLLVKPFMEFNPDIYTSEVLMIIGNRQIVHGQKEIKHFDLSWLFPYNGWGKLFQGKTHVFKIPCDHLELMEEPYCEEVGEIIHKTASSS